MDQRVAEATRKGPATAVYILCALGIEFPQGVLLDRASGDGVLTGDEPRMAARETLMVALITIEETGAGTRHARAVEPHSLWLSPAARPLTV